MKRFWNKAIFLAIEEEGVVDSESIGKRESIWIGNQSLIRVIKREE